MFILNVTQHLLQEPDPVNKHSVNGNENYLMNNLSKLGLKGGCVGVDTCKICHHSYSLTLALKTWLALKKAYDENNVKRPPKWDLKGVVCKPIVIITLF